MPHGRQKRAQGNYGVNINVDAVRTAMGLADSDATPAAAETEHSGDASLNSSYQSEVSDDVDENLDGDDGGEDMEDEEEEPVARHDSLSTFLSFKPVSGDSALFIMKDGASVYLKGKVQVCVVQGSVEVLGHTLRPATGCTAVYSPRGYSLLALTARGAAPPPDLQDRLLAEGVSFDEARDVKGDCVLVVKRLTEPWTKYLHKNLNLQTKMNLLQRDHNLPAELQHEEAIGEVEKQLDINLVHPDSGHLRLFRPGEDWELALSSLDITARGRAAAPRLLVAGGKGVGKSTFLRWVTNRLLAAGPVVFLDLDPGQAELGLPGYLSLATITAPLLGPNFSHAGDRPTELSIFLGDINVANCPGRFMRCVGQLVDRLDSCERLRGLPVVVNTMGWARGVGLMLLVDTIRLLRPSTIVQLHSRFHRKNLPFSLSPEKVSAPETESWRSAPPVRPLAYNLLEFLAVPEREGARDMRTKDYWGLPDPRLTRELVLLAGLGRAGGLEGMAVYRVPLAAVSLHVAHAKVEPGALLAAISLAVVDLCTVEPRLVRRAAGPGLHSGLHRTPVVPSLGFGVVRNIDMEARVLYLATGADPTLVAVANCLVGGSARLPDSVVLGHRAGRGDRQYVAAEPENPLDLPWQRNFKPRGHAGGTAG